jgi:hypothetical protein
MWRNLPRQVCRFGRIMDDLPGALTAQASSALVQEKCWCAFALYRQEWPRSHQICFDCRLSKTPNRHNALFRTLSKHTQQSWVDQVIQI